MRVLELSQRFLPAIGGVEATLLELVVGLRAAGVDVEVGTTDLLRNYPFTRGASGPGPDGIPIHRSRAVRIAPLPLGLGIVAPGMLPNTALSGAHVLHAHAFGYSPTWVGALVRRFRGTPLVLTTHADPGRGTPFSSVYHRVVARGTVRYADRIVVQSSVEANFLLGLGADPERIVRIPTGVSRARFSSAGAGRGRGPVRLLTVGRLDLEQKGLRTLLEALALLPRSLDFQAEILGDDWGGLAPGRALAERLWIADRVHLRTHVVDREVLQAYDRADVFVLPSRFESFPRVLLEAMASGLPIVATRVGGVSELVAEGENGLLVPPDDPPALAEAIRRLAEDPELRGRFGAASRRKIAPYDWSALIPQYVDLFQGLVG
jgi:glycosyltransferase involved in cell wall biosynthesis